jgi:hypothetical protein
MAATSLRCEYPPAHRYSYHAICSRRVCVCVHTQFPSHTNTNPHPHKHLDNHITNLCVASCHRSSGPREIFPCVGC